MTAIAGWVPEWDRAVAVTPRSTVESVNEPVQAVHWLDPDAELVIARDFVTPERVLRYVGTAGAWYAE